MSEEIHVADIAIEVVRKDVKNINMRVYPSKGKVRISAPWYLRMKVIRQFADSRADWIRKHLDKYEQGRHDRREPEFVSGESHYYFGKEMRLQVVTADRPPQVTADETNRVLVLGVRPGTDRARRKKILMEWYRMRLKEEIGNLVAKWEVRMGVEVSEFGVKQMKTRWGSCNIRAKRIWLNLELAKKSPQCLESVVVHEMVHLLERLHNKRFYRLMDRFLPEWRAIEKELQGRVD